MRKTMFILLVIAWQIPFLLPSSSAGISESLNRQEHGSVARAAFTSEIIAREPVDNLDTVYTDMQKLFFFTELRELTGERVTHRWVYNGEEMARKDFEVQGPRWRVNTSKNLLPEWTGEWSCQVLVDDGTILYEKSFVYMKGEKGETAYQIPTIAEKDSAELPQAVASKHVRRAILTSSVVEREPVDNLNANTTDLDVIYFFTEIVDLENHTISHRWLHEGEVLADVPFEIGGPRWRVYSRKKLIDSWRGNWLVQVVGADSSIMHQERFIYEPGQN